MTPTPEGRAPHAGLIDPFGRRIEYLRLSVTDRCDLRCTYCLPKGHRDFKPPAEWLSFEEMERIVRAFAALGTRRIRLTGGEPLVRPDVPALAARLSAIPGIEDLSLSTNGVRLTRLAGPLRRAGVSRVNVSLDTLRPERFRALTGGKLAKVLAGIDAAADAGFAPVKINMVVLRGTNDDEVEDMVRYCTARGFVLRLIETMPLGSTGCAATGSYVDLQRIKEELGRRFNLLPDVVPGGGPARYYRVAGSATRIGFITPMSQHFCATCNRVRLAADGTLYLCLGQEDCYDLRGPLRAGADQRALEEHVAHAIARKPERHEFREKPAQIVRFMAATGG